MQEIIHEHAALAMEMEKELAGNRSLTDQRTKTIKGTFRKFRSDTQTNGVHTHTRKLIRNMLCFCLSSIVIRVTYLSRFCWTGMNGRESPGKVTFQIYEGGGCFFSRVSHARPN